MSTSKLRNKSGLSRSSTIDNKDERELFIEELEHLVLAVVRHEVDTGADIGASDEFERQSVARGRDAVGAAVISAIEGTALGARCAIAAYLIYLMSNLVIFKVCMFRTVVAVPLVPSVAWSGVSNIARGFKNKTYSLCIPQCYGPNASSRQV
jgi:hypothetical protein